MKEYGSEFDLDSNDHYMDSNSRSPFFKGAELFRSGRDALKTIAQSYKGICRRIVLPALCCESMIIPFLTNNYEAVYFKLNNDLTANVEDIFSILRPADIFLFMNYFGVRSLTDDNLLLIKNRFPKIVVIEDKTHDILSPPKNKFVADYTISSIRKWLAAPDGGLLFSNAAEKNFVKSKDTYFSELRLKALKNKSAYLKTKNQRLKQLFRNQLFEADEYLNNDKSIIGMSLLSRNLLETINFNKIAEARRKNIRMLCQELKNITDIRLLDFFNYNKTLLYFPILITERDSLQKRLAQAGIYCPVIWPLPGQAAGICNVADHVAGHMLALPCDQRYDISDMKYIAGTLKRFLRE